MPLVYPFSFRASAAGGAATWDSATKSSHFALSNGNYTATGDDASSTSASLISLNGKSSGKWYAEIKTTTVSAGKSAVGIALSSFTNTSASDAATVRLRADALMSIGGSTGGTTGGNTEPSFTTNSVVQIAYDAGNGRLWFGVDNSYASGANPSSNTNPDVTGLSGTFYLYGLCDGTFGANCTGVYVIQSVLNYTPPSGFSLWG